MWLSFRGFAMLTRGYRVVRPPWGRLPRRHSAAKSRERRLPRRHPGSMSLWYRCPRAYVSATHPAMLPSPSPSRQHVAVIPRSPCLYLCSRCAKLPAPQGSHYSITAGERSEPAEGGLPPPSAPRGSNARRVWVSCAGIPSGGSSTPVCCRGWLCRAYARSTPLGPYIYMCGSPSAGSPCSPAVTE